MEDWMWRKIIEKMYDPKDYEVLEQRFLFVIEERNSLTNQDLVYHSQK